MIEVFELAEKLRDYVSRDKVIEIFTEADEVAGEYVIISFNAKNVSYVEGINLIFRYLPYVSKILQARLEVLISKDLPATEFLTIKYKALIREGIEVALKRDGISLFCKLNVENADVFISDFKRRLITIMNIIEGSSNVEITYKDFMVIRRG